MKNFSLISMMILLIVSSFISPLAASANSGTEQSFTLTNAVIEADAADKSKAKVRFDWNFVAGEEGKGGTYTFQVPSDVTIELEQTGSLLVNGDTIGSYKVSTDGTITVTIIEGLKSGGSGSMEFAAKSAAATDQPTEETTAQDAASGIEGNTVDEGIGPEEGEAGAGQETTDKTGQVKDDDIKDGNKINENNKGLLQSGSSVITENILTSAKLTYFKSETSSEVVGSVDRNSIIKVDYTWKLEDGHSYKDGATFTFNLPSELKVYEAINNEPLKFDTNTIGTFNVNMNGEVTVVFNSFIENHSNISGTIEVLSKISETVVVTEDKKVTVTPIAGKESVDIPITFHPSGSTIDKKGIPNKAYNTETVEWTVDFNKNLDSISNAVLSDPIQDGQEFKKGSIKVYKLITLLNGTVKQGEELASGFTIGQAEGKDFSVSLGNISTAYRVVYTTKIIDQDMVKFDNTATLSGDGFTPQKATASIGVKRGAALAKSSTAYDQGKQIITWEIKYNYNEKSIKQADALLKDYFNDTQDLVDGSFTVKKITIDSNGNESGAGEDFTGYTVTPKAKDGKKGFELQFNQDIQHAFKITYKTKATDRVFSSAEITNDVEAGEEKATGKRTIYQQIIYKKHYKNHPQTDYGKKTTTWSIDINIDSYLMKNVKITDSFTNEGLKLLPDTLKITDSSKKELKIDEDYRLVNNDNAGFVIEFLHDIDKPHRIDYQTSFNYEARKNTSNNSLDNTAVISWTDEQGKSQTKDSTAKFEPDSYTKSNGFKNGSYNAVTKEITWNVGINYNLKTLTNASVEDEILGNQVIDQKSLKVYKMTLTGEANGTKRETAIENTDYTVKWDPTGKPGFKVEFLHEINSAYLIEYKTSLENQLIKGAYENTATLYDGTAKVTDLTASVSVPNGGEYTKKSGTQNGKIIDWKVRINFGQSKVSNVKLIDTPTENQTLLEQSFHLYATTVAENGAVTKGAELVKDVDYTLEFINGGFELAFKEDIDKPYILEYQSLILAKVGDKVNNDIEFTGAQITTETTKSSSSVEVKRTTGLGTGTGEVGSLEIVKVDASDDTKTLAGATFSLIDEVSGAVIKTLTTNEEGKVKFEKLLYGEYLLKEDRAPEGYVVGINGTQVVKIEKPEATLTIKNAKIHQAVELTKVDKADKSTSLHGAEFELQRKNGADFVKVSTHVTDESGKIIVNNLEPGDYQFVEIQAAEHYLLDDTPVTFTIKKDQTSIVKVTKENERGIGSLTVLKVDGSTNKPLEGAEFELYNSKNELVAKKTTDAEGKTIFENLAFDNYVLKEVKAPAGYVIQKASENMAVKLDAEKKEVMVKNYKPSTGGPGDPGDPGEPGEPGKPGEPGNPEEPGNPGEPGKPGEPGNPGEPGKPGEPGNPGEPGKPGEPGNPGDSDNPGNPNNPGDSGNPGNPNNPGGSNNPGNPDNSNNPNQGNQIGGPNQSNQGNGKVLPQTGEEANMTLPLAGIVLIFIGLGMAFTRRKIES